ncbi:MAG: alpha/beta hydrolase, partial [archaeon]|nr:alpha/beta hydrolase [archaeon]
MSKKLNLFCLIMFIGMFTSSLVLTVYSNSIMDSEPIGEQYSIPINRPIGQSIVYHEWEPKISSIERDNRVCFLFAGFLASQEMMYPLMRELTGLGYHVITGDFQGHGYSGGLVSMNWSTLLDDFDLIYNDVFTRNPTWNSTHVAIAGHSMGGFAVTLFGSNRSYVHTTVAFAPATHPSVLSEGSINNYMLIIGELDELIPPASDWAFFQQLG